MPWEQATLHLAVQVTKGVEQQQAGREQVLAQAARTQVSGAPGEQQQTFVCDAGL